MCRWLGIHETAVTSRHAAGFTGARGAAAESDPSSCIVEGESQ
jgi:hypothetical protein